MITNVEADGFHFSRFFLYLSNCIERPLRSNETNLHKTSETVFFSQIFYRLHLVVIDSAADNGC